MGLLIVICFLVIWGTFLINGKGTNLLAGYNTMSKEKKERYDNTAVAKLLGKVAYALAFSNLLWLIGDIYHIKWLVITGLSLLIIIIVSFIIYFKKSDNLKK